MLSVYLSALIQTLLSLGSFANLKSRFVGLPLSRPTEPTFECFSFTFGFGFSFSSSFSFASNKSGANSIWLRWDWRPSVCSFVGSLELWSELVQEMVTGPLIRSGPLPPVQPQRQVSLANSI